MRPVSLCSSDSLCLRQSVSCSLARCDIMEENSFLCGLDNNSIETVTFTSKTNTTNI